MNNFAKVVISILTVVFLVIVSIYGVGYLQRGTADFRGETQQIEKTKANADFRIASYNKFFDRCAGIQSLESKIENMKEELALTSDDTQRVTVLKTSITAAKNKRADLISSYNADARKEATQGQFKASDLPYQLSEEGSTLCENY